MSVNITFLDIFRNPMIKPLILGNLKTLKYTSILHDIYKITNKEKPLKLGGPKRILSYYSISMTSTWIANQRHFHLLLDKIIHSRLKGYIFKLTFKAVRSLLKYNLDLSILKRIHQLEPMTFSLASRERQASHKKSLLEISCYNSTPQIVEYLLSVNMNPKLSVTYQSIGISVRSGNAKLYEFLSGLKCARSHQYKVTVDDLELVVRKNKIEMVECLMRRKQIPLFPEKFFSIAIRNNSLPMVELLFESRRCIVECTENTLSVAIKENRVEIVKLIHNRFPLLSGKLSHLDYSFVGSEEVRVTLDLDKLTCINILFGEISKNNHSVVKQLMENNSSYWWGEHYSNEKLSNVLYYADFDLVVWILEKLFQLKVPVKIKIEDKSFQSFRLFNESHQWNRFLNYEYDTFEYMVSHPHLVESLEYHSYYGKHSIVDRAIQLRLYNIAKLYMLHRPEMGDFSDLAIIYSIGQGSIEMFDLLSQSLPTDGTFFSSYRGYVHGRGRGIGIGGRGRGGRGRGGRGRPNLKFYNPVEVRSLEMLKHLNEKKSTKEVNTDLYTSTFYFTKFEFDINLLVSEESDPKELLSYALENNLVADSQNIEPWLLYFISQGDYDTLSMIKFVIYPPYQKISNWVSHKLYNTKHIPKNVRIDIKYIKFLYRYELMDLNELNQFFIMMLDKISIVKYGDDYDGTTQLLIEIPSALEYIFKNPTSTRSTLYQSIQTIMYMNTNGAGLNPQLSKFIEHLKVEPNLTRILLEFIPHFRKIFVSSFQEIIKEWYTGEGCKLYSKLVWEIFSGRSPYISRNQIRNMNIKIPFSSIIHQQKYTWPWVWDYVTISTDSLNELLLYKAISANINLLPKGYDASKFYSNDEKEFILFNDLSHATLTNLINSFLKTAVGEPEITFNAASKEWPKEFQLVEQRFVYFHPKVVYMLSNSYLKINLLGCIGDRPVELFKLKHHFLLNSKHDDKKYSGHTTLFALDDQLEKEMILDYVKWFIKSENHFIHLKSFT
ncbi:hypothetical protein DLAC_01104 [Tieghemostelium lacteum]|uniref:Uncharacterized protein n=1 Tax=Tieghemostelium lacteum TaxID=361077 RepID=A0A152A7R1_TIELA|nr:hypothetical protein DLAC_01104 [Tieghemostelium lacteum]|eukprot:KYR02273.1 hypothetical protein DLAC_01104 [Tieghemostelium lacteum]